MKAVDRILRAYARKYPLTAEQTTAVRREVSVFVDELLSATVHSLAIEDHTAGNPEPKI
jgi:hypothetical protein